MIFNTNVINSSLYYLKILSNSAFRYFVLNTPDNNKISSMIICVHSVSIWKFLGLNITDLQSMNIHEETLKVLYIDMINHAP